MKVNWSSIETEYVQTEKPVSLEALAKKHNVSFSSIFHQQRTYIF